MRGGGFALAALLTCAVSHQPTLAQAHSNDVAQSGRLSVDQAQRLADNDNLDVITARLSEATAKAALRTADRSPNPVLALSGVQVRPSQIGILPYGRLVDSIVHVDLPLERGGKRQARTASARASVAAAQGDLANVRRQMYATVTQAYYSLKAAEERLRFQQAIASEYAASEKIAQLQQTSGALSKGNLAKQHVEVLRAQADVKQAQADLRDTQLLLAVLVGREEAAPSIATEGDWPATDAGNTLPASELVDQRPDVVAAEARAEAARCDLDSARALRHPDITLGAQYEHAGEGVGVGDSIGLSLSVPLLVRHRYSGEIDGASTAVVQAEVRARKARALAAAEIVNARRALADATARRRLIVEDELPAARKAQTVAQFAYSHGALPLIDLLDARRSLEAVELRAIDARSDEAKALADARAAVTLIGDYRK